MLSWCQLLQSNTERPETLCTSSDRTIRSQCEQSVSARGMRDAGWSSQGFKRAIRSLLTGLTVYTRARKLPSSHLPRRLAPLATSRRNLPVMAGDKGAAMAGDKVVAGEVARPLRKPAHLPKNKSGSLLRAADTERHASAEGDRR